MAQDANALRIRFRLRINQVAQQLNWAFIERVTSGAALTVVVTNDFPGSLLLTSRWQGKNTQKTNGDAKRSCTHHSDFLILMRFRQEYRMMRTSSNLTTPIRVVSRPTSISSEGH